MTDPANTYQCLSIQEGEECKQLPPSSTPIAYQQVQENLGGLAVQNNPVCVLNPQNLQLQPANAIQSNIVLPPQIVQTQPGAHLGVQYTTMSGQPAQSSSSIVVVGNPPASSAPVVTPQRVHLSPSSGCVYTETILGMIFNCIFGCFCIIGAVLTCVIIVRWHYLPIGLTFMVGFTGFLVGMIGLIIACIASRTKNKIAHQTSHGCGIASLAWIGPTVIATCIVVIILIAIIVHYSYEVLNLIFIIFLSNTVSNSHLISGYILS